MRKSFPLCRSGCYLSLRWLINKIIGTDRVPKNGSVILAPNHSSVVDGVLLTALLNISRLSPCHTIVQKESFKEDFFGYLLRSCKCIPVDRQCKQSIIDMFRLALTYLELGDRVMVFPEGHLNNGETLRLARPGAALLALESGAPVLPVGIKGTRDIFPVGGKFNPFARAQIYYGKLIDTSGLSLKYHNSGKDERKIIIDDLSLRIMKQISELSGIQMHRRMR